MARLRVQTRSLPFLRIYNSIVYALSACIYLAILVGLELHSPGVHVFIARAPQRDTFMSLSIVTFALLAAASVVLLALYFPSKSPDRLRSRRYPEVTLCVLSTFVTAFLAIFLGLCASIAAAALVFLGQRDRYKVFEQETTTLRSWAIPVITGILPAAFFGLMALGTARAMWCGCLAFREFFAARKAPAGSGSTARGAGEGSADSAGSASVESAESGLAYGGPLSPDQERAVDQLAEMGYTNRNASIAALEASAFDVGDAQTRLMGAQQASVCSLFVKVAGDGSK